MNRIYACLAYEHEPALLLLAVAICLVGCTTTLRLVRRLRERQRLRWVWLVAAPCVAGSTVWTTHFVAMLAFKVGMPVGYDWWLTGLSAGVAVVFAAAAFALMSGRAGLVPWQVGALLGLGFDVMHYVGMDGLEVPAVIVWRPQLLALSITSGIVLSALAFHIAFGTARRALTPLGAPVLTLAICLLHVIGMAALDLVPTPLKPMPVHTTSEDWLVIAVTGASAVIIGFAVLAIALDRHLGLRDEREAERLRSLVDAAFEGIVIHQNGIIVDINEGLARLTGYHRHELIGGPVFAGLSGATATTGCGVPRPCREVACEREIAHKDGRTIPVEILVRDIDYLGQRAHVAALRDISERRETARIRHLAHHDVLTDLPNRMLFRQRLEQALAQAAHDGAPLAVLCIDLDEFKEVNDLYGHAAGDALLRQVAAALRESTRGGDTVARLGGDEFALLQIGAKQPFAAAELAQRLIDALARDYHLTLEVRAVRWTTDGRDHTTGGEAATREPAPTRDVAPTHDVATTRDVNVRIGASIGIALYPSDGNCPDGLLDKADTALYRAKGEGRNTFCLFDREIEARLEMQRELRKAIGNDVFEVHYQPQARLSDHAIVGFEALLRWHHPERGSIPPETFVPVAEASGLIVPLGAFVLRKACKTAASWPNELRVAVNVSPVQFAQDDLVERVRRALADTGLAPERLELEITEATLLYDEGKQEPGHVVATLERLKALGVRIVMDDFGTGYSSLGHLRRFAFDRIKVDRCFVRDLLAKSEAASMVRAVIALSHNLGMEIIAEGVETDSQLRALRDQHCDEIQGFIIGKPMPRREIGRFLESRRPRPELKLVSGF